MSDAVPLFRDAAFDPQTVELLTAAYEQACIALRDMGQPEIVQQIIAQRIIAAATRGERDPDKLCESALSALRDRNEPA